MSNLSDLPLLLGQGHQLVSGHVQTVPESGQIEVRVPGLSAVIRCRVLQAGESASPLVEGDEVLLWLGDADAGGAVVLGRIGLQAAALQAVVPTEAFAARPRSVVIETQGDLILRNGQARIKLGAAGDIEIDCASFVTRSRRLLRMLAPFIKLN